MSKVQVIEEGLEESELQELWRRWGWKILQQSPEHTVLEGSYRTPYGEVRGRIEIIPAADPALRFYTWDAHQGTFQSRCIRAASLEQGILTLQSVLKPS